MLPLISVFGLVYYTSYNQNPYELECIMLSLCTLVSTQGSNLNDSKAFQRKFLTEQWDNTVYQC